MCKTLSISILEQAKLISLLPPIASSASSQNSVSVSAANRDSMLETEPLVLANSCIECQVQVGTGIVHPKFRIIKWNVPCTVFTTNDHISRYPPDGIRYSLLGKNQRNLVRTEQK